MEGVVRKLKRVIGMWPRQAEEETKERLDQYKDFPAAALLKGLMVYTKKLAKDSGYSGLITFEDGSLVDLRGSDTKVVNFHPDEPIYILNEKNVQIYP